MTPYNLGLDKNPANYVPLSPLSFLRRVADVYPDRVALIHGHHRHNWRETYLRCRRLASALQRRGVGPGDTVAVMAPNIPNMFEAHYAIPMTGAVINLMRRKFLSAPPRDELVRAKYQLDAFLKEYPGNVEALSGPLDRRLDTVLAALAQT